MTLRFSAALPTVRNHVPAGLGRIPVRGAANDNPRDVRNDPALRAALRHFAAFGLGAASDARDRALRAHQAGDAAGYRRWLEICARLDRRMAAALSRQIGQN